VEAIRTKFGNEKIVTTWNYLGSDKIIHKVVMKHNTRNKRSKRIVIIDKQERYNQKSTDTKFFIRVGPDQLKISIEETAARTYNYNLLINDKKFETLRRDFFKEKQSRIRAATFSQNP